MAPAANRPTQPTDPSNTNLANNASPIIPDQAPATEPTENIVARPYLRTAGRATAADTSTPELDRLLSSNAPVTWSTVLGLLPDRATSELLAKARRATAKLKEPAPDELPELVSEAVARSDRAENMFSPFTVVLETSAGLQRETQPRVHWAHVDTGAMINLVHRGVLTAFPALQRYAEPCADVRQVRGIGGVV